MGASPCRLSVPTVGGLNLTGTRQVFPQRLLAGTTLVGSGAGDREAKAQTGSGSGLSLLSGCHRSVRGRVYFLGS